MLHEEWQLTMHAREAGAAYALKHVSANREFAAMNFEEAAYTVIQAYRNSPKPKYLRSRWPSFKLGLYDGTREGVATVIHEHGRPEYWAKPDTPASAALNPAALA